VLQRVPLTPLTQNAYNSEPSAYYFQKLGWVNEMLETVSKFNVIVINHSLIFKGPAPIIQRAGPYYSRGRTGRPLLFKGPAPIIQEAGPYCLRGRPLLFKGPAPIISWAGPYYFKGRPLLFRGRPLLFKGPAPII
jgi:hypothetical protein